MAPQGDSVLRGFLGRLQIHTDLAEPVIRPFLGEECASFLNTNRIGRSSPRFVVLERFGLVLDLSSFPVNQGIGASGDSFRFSWQDQ